MGTPLRALGLLGVLLVAAPAPARAEWHLTPFLGLTFKGDTTLLDQEQATGKVHWNFGGAVAVMGSGPVGVEGLVVYTPGFFEQDNPPAVDGVLPPNVVDSRTFRHHGQPRADDAAQLE